MEVKVRTLIRLVAIKINSITLAGGGKAKNNFLPQRQEQVFRLWFQQIERKTEVPMM